MLESDHEMEKKKKIKLSRNFHFIEQFVLLSQHKLARTRIESKVGGAAQI